MVKELLCGFVLASLVMASQSSRPNFSGLWQEDQSKTTKKITPKANTTPARSAEKPPPPPPPPPPPSGARPQPTEIIEHREPLLKITKRGTLRFDLATDGKERRDVIFGEMVQKTKAYWQGNKLVLELRTERAGKIVMEIREVRTLSGDGNRQFVEQKVSNLESETETHLILVKQNNPRK
jgi:hypothetical protein